MRKVYLRKARLRYPHKHQAVHHLITTKQGELRCFVEVCLHLLSQPLYSPLSRFLHSQRRFMRPTSLSSGAACPVWQQLRAQLTKALNRSSSKKKLPWAAAETSLKEVLASAPVIRRNTTSTPPLTRFLLPLCSTITIALTRTSFVF